MKGEFGKVDSHFCKSKLWKKEKMDFADILGNHLFPKKKGGGCPSENHQSFIVGKQEGALLHI